MTIETTALPTHIALVARRLNICSPDDLAARFLETSYLAEAALKKGALIIAAAGNESSRPGDIQPVGHPANCPGIMAVGAIDRNYRLGWFSNGGLNLNGGKVDIVAPGVDIYSSYPTGSPPYKRLNGTSMATPIVAGIAALFAEATGLRGNALWAELTRRALPLNESTSDVGAGLVQAP